MKYLLEYNEEQGSFHYNSLNPDGTWDQKVNSYGWVPICIITEKYAVEKDDNGFGDIMNRLAKKHSPVEAVYDQIYRFFLNDDND